MYLSQLLIFNYRSCKQVTISLEPNQPNVLIGVNDCGKTTVLKALKLLFEEKSTYKFQSDATGLSDLSNSPLDETSFEQALSNLGLPAFSYQGTETVIIGKFRIEEEETEESFQQYSDQLRLCREFSHDCSIWLLRSFTGSGAVKTSIFSKECEEDRADPLLGLTEAKLKTLNGALGIRDEDIPNINNSGKLSKYERIKAVYSIRDLTGGWKDFKFDKNDRLAFPEFRYLDWNCSLEDIKKQANDLLSDKISAAFQTLRNDVLRAAQTLEESVNADLSANLLSTLTTVVPSLTGIVAKLSPPEIRPVVSEILVTKSTSDNLVHIESQGEGIKRQIWYGLLKAQAQRLAIAGTRKQYIWAFDEPETHLYPGAQRGFFDLLREAAAGGVQILLSTHSTIFVDKTSLQELKKVVLQDSYTTINTCNSPEDVFTSLKLKNSDFLFHDKFLVVEGPSEMNLIPRLYFLHRGRTLLQDNIQLINLEGSSNWVTNNRLFSSIMTDFKKDMNSVVYVFDKDQQVAMDEELPDARKFYLGVQDMEDSIDATVWELVVNEYFREEGITEVSITAAEIRSIQESITETSVNQSDKFVKKLSSKVAQLMQGSQQKAFLPGKPELATRVCKHIRSIDQICPQVRAAFSELISVDTEITTNANSAVAQLLDSLEVEVEPYPRATEN